jgi:polysaccharide export outer membrane protein
MRTRFLVFSFIALLFLFASCASPKKTTYFQGTSDDISYPIIPDTIEAPIQKGDILDITISSLNKAASEDFNQSREGNQNIGYLVGTDGAIQMPILGSVGVAGLTKRQLKEKISKLILDKGLLLDPIVDIRHTNFEVTVLGEVAKPSVINVPSEQITLTKALGLAGDLTIYGRRENVLLIREEKGVRKTVRLNLNNAEVLNTPYYFLRPNDIIYVEPNKSKVASTDKALIIMPLILSMVSIVLIVATLFIK